MALSRIFSKRLKNVQMGFYSLTREKYFHTENEIAPVERAGKVTDVLLNKIRNSGNPNELLNIISQHNQVFNQKHVLQALTSIHDLYKADKKNFSSQIVRDPSFERLCTKLKTYSRTLEMGEVIESLKVLSILGIPAHSSIYQMLLQIIRENINQLNLQQICFLDFILRKLENNHLADALMLALPLVFQLNLTMQIDGQDIRQLVDLLRYSSQNDIPPKLVTTIVTAALLNDENLSKNTAKSIVWSICDIDTPDDQSKHAHINLLFKCLKTMEEKLNGYRTFEVFKTMLKLKDKIILENQSDFYSESFFNACGNYAIENKHNFIDVLQFARCMSRIGFSHLPMLEYMCDEAVIDIEILSKCRPVILFSFVNALSNANYKPHNWDKIQMQIFSNPILNVKMKTIKLPWSKFAIEMASLDSYDDRLLEILFSEEFLKVYLERENTHIDYIQLLNLQQAVTLFHKTYEGSLLPQHYFENAKHQNKIRECDKSVQKFLENGFGGEQYIASNVLMPNGVIVDFVIAFRTGNYPIAINTKNTNNNTIQYEDLSINIENKVLCILLFQPRCYSLNSHRLRGNYALSLKILEEMGYNVVPVSLLKWSETPEAEKIPYIMREFEYNSSRNALRSGNKIT